MTVFYEGAQVEWAGGGFQAVGHIISLGTNAAHVKWTSGPDADTISFVDLFDIEPITAVKHEEDPMHLVAVRRAYDDANAVGVLNFLAKNNYLDSWPKIAQDVITFIEDRIRVDASMNLVDEQLTVAEREAVVKEGALALIRDAFSVEEE